MKTIDSTLAWLWNEPVQTHPWDIKVYVRRSEWTAHSGLSTDDHSQGFNILETIEITDYMENKSLKQILLEVDDFRTGNFGIIRASKISQDFYEEPENQQRQPTGKPIQAIGSILQQILTEYGESTDWYKVDSDDVHLWELLIKIGEADNNVWITFDYIYGWRFAPEGDTLPSVPKWDGVKRDTPQKFTFDAYSLLHWAGFVDSALLGDYSNKSGVYNSGASDHEYLTDGCNYAIWRLLKLIVNTLGVKDEYYSCSVKPLIESTALVSCFEFQSLLSGATEPAGEMPGIYRWKWVGDYVYLVWHPGWYGTTDARKLVVTVLDRDNNLVSTELVSIGAFLSTEEIKRLWFDEDNGNRFFVLSQDSDSEDFKVRTVTLSGIAGSVSASTSTITLDPPTMGASSNDAQGYHLQMDIDFTDKTIWGCVTEKEADNTQYGYWDISDGSWTAVGAEMTDRMIYTISGFYGYFFGGFRCLRHSSGDHVLANYTIYESAGTNYQYLSFYSEAGDEFYHYPVVTGTDIFTNPEALYQFAGQCATDSYYVPNGMGSIGGYVSEDNCYFQMNLFGVHGEPGIFVDFAYDDISGTFNYDTTSLIFRSFSSHGSLTKEYSTGWLVNQVNLETAGGAGGNYYLSMLIAVFYLDGGVQEFAYASEEDDLYFGFQRSFASGFLGTGDDWPIVAPPMPSSYDESTEYTDDPKCKPFLIFREDVVFVDVYDLYWFPNFSKDFTTDGGSFAEELDDIALAYNLLIHLNLYDTLIRNRYEGTEDDVVKTISIDHYQYNLQKTERILGYDRVDLEVNGTTYKYPSTIQSKNTLSLSSDYVLPNVASARAEQLYNEHHEDRLKYIVTAYHLPYLEPLDIVLFESIVTPGHDVNDGDDAILCFIQRISIEGETSTLELVTIESGQGIP